MGDGSKTKRREDKMACGRYLGDDQGSLPNVADALNKIAAIGESATARTGGRS